jgi:DNA modification methylase
LGWEVYQGDAAAVLRELPTGAFDSIITSPPYYWQRDYGVEGQMGKEPRIDDYVMALVATMSEARRVLKREGTLFLNLGDTYYSGKGEPKGVDKKSKKRRFGLRAVDASGLGVPPKTIIGIPWRIALAMIADGWVLRAPIVWERKDCLSEPSAKDRPWRTYEFVFMFAKSRHYFFDRNALQGHEDVWRISARPQGNGLGTASFPDQLVRRCLEVGCPSGGKVLDPFAGSGTTMRVAIELGRNAVGIDLNPEFCEYAAAKLLRS